MGLIPTWAWALISGLVVSALVWGLWPERDREAPRDPRSAIKRWEYGGAAGGQLDGLGDVSRAEIQARALDPDAWRLFLTPAEFAETFPGVPYWPEAYDGPHTGDLAAVDPRVADQLGQLDAEVREYMNQRAAAYGLDRARFLAAWQAIRYP